MAQFKISSLDIKKIIQHKNFSIFIIAGLLFLSLLDILFLLSPEIKAIKKLGSESLQLNQKVTLGKRELADFEKLKANLEVKTKQLEKEENSFSSEEDFELLIEDISKAASDSEVKIIQIKPSREGSPAKIQATKEGSFEKVPIIIQAFSSYHSLGEFINQLETKSKFFKVSELDVVSNALDYKKSSVTMQVMTILKLK